MKVRFGMNWIILKEKTENLLEKAIRRNFMSGITLIII